jgi:hypothetical protein
MMGLKTSRTQELVGGVTSSRKARSNILTIGSGMTMGSADLRDVDWVLTNRITEWHREHYLCSTTRYIRASYSEAYTTTDVRGASYQKESGINSSVCMEVVIQVAFFITIYIQLITNTCPT